MLREQYTKDTEKEAQYAETLSELTDEGRIPATDMRPRRDTPMIDILIDYDDVTANIKLLRKADNIEINGSSTVWTYHLTDDVRFVIEQDTNPSISNEWAVYVYDN